jgi:hypothetical protein
METPHEKNESMASQLARFLMMELAPPGLKYST